MEGYLIQLKADMLEELYWSSIEIEEEVFKDAYKMWREENTNYYSFEIWWNDQDTGITLERVFLNEIWI